MFELFPDALRLRRKKQSAERHLWRGAGAVVLEVRLGLARKRCGVGKAGGREFRMDRTFMEIWFRACAYPVSPRTPLVGPAQFDPQPDTQPSARRLKCVVAFWQWEMALQHQS